MGNCCAGSTSQPATRRSSSGSLPESGVGIVPAGSSGAEDVSTNAQQQQQQQPIHHFDNRSIGSRDSAGGGGSTDMRFANRGMLTPDRGPSSSLDRPCGGRSHGSSDWHPNTTTDGSSAGAADGAARGTKRSILMFAQEANLSGGGATNASATIAVRASSQQSGTHGGLSQDNGSFDVLSAAPPPPPPGVLVAAASESPGLRSPPHAARGGESSPNPGGDFNSARRMERSSSVHSLTMSLISLGGVPPDGSLRSAVVGGAASSGARVRTTSAGGGSRTTVAAASASGPHRGPGSSETNSPRNHHAGVSSSNNSPRSAHPGSVALLELWPMPDVPPTLTAEEFLAGLAAARRSSTMEMDNPVDQLPGHSAPPPPHCGSMRIGQQLDHLPPLSGVTARNPGHDRQRSTEVASFSPLHVAVVSSGSLEVDADSTTNVGAEHAVEVVASGSLPPHQMPELSGDDGDCSPPPQPTRRNHTNNSSNCSTGMVSPLAATGSSADGDIEATKGGNHSGANRRPGGGGPGRRRSTKPSGFSSVLTPEEAMAASRPPLSRSSVAVVPVSPTTRTGPPLYPHSVATASGHLPRATGGRSSISGAHSPLHVASAPHHKRMTIDQEPFDAELGDFGEFVGEAEVDSD